MKIRSILLFVILVSGLLACGGSGDDGSSSGPPNTGISAETKEFADAAKETASQILSSESNYAFPAPRPVPVSPADILKDALAISPQDQMAAFSASGRQLEPLGTASGSGSTDGECGGSASFTYTQTWDDDTTFPYIFDYDYVLDNYCLISGEYQIVYNGGYSIYVDYTDAFNGDIEIIFDISFTTNFPFFPSGTLRYTEICSLREGVETCTTGVYVSGTTTYYTSDVSVSGNASSGYNVSYTITDSEGNVLSVEFTDLIPCDNGNVASGSGTITYNGDEVISIEFISCDEFVVTYNGSSGTYPQ